MHPLNRDRSDTLPPPVRRSRAWVWIAAIGPGVLGLAADNDAGGMLSYLLTGAAHHLLWFIGVMAIMAPVTYLIQELALRVALATQLPYGQLLAIRFGSWVARANGLILHGLNGLNLVTEFIGMAGALALFGLPWRLGVPISLALVSAITVQRRYLRLERVLLLTSLLNLSFIPVLFFLHPTGKTLSTAFFGGGTAPVGFLLLALAGNTIAPWMIYWQQNAVWAGSVKSLAQGRLDIRLGVIAQGVMATVVMLIGGLARGGFANWQSPLQWLAAAVGPWAGKFFAIGLFDAGFMAACTISMSSAWMLRESFRPSDADQRWKNPISGTVTAIHLSTLFLAAAATLLPFAPGAIALWAQAAGALWMPVSLLLLGIIATDRRLMGPMLMRNRRRFLLGTVVAGFLCLGVWTLLSVG